MVEPAAAREQQAKSRLSSSTTIKHKKKKTMLSAPPTKPDKEERLEAAGSTAKKYHPMAAAAEAAVGSPSYRLALKSIFSCRNSHGHGHHPPPPDSATKKQRKQQLGCSSASICKLKDSSPPRWLMMQQRPPPPAEPEPEPEPCKRRASVSGDRRPLVKTNKQPQQLNGNGRSLSSASSSSSAATAGGGSSFRLRRLSGCYECHMVVDPISGVFRDSSHSMRVFSCPDCAEIFVRAETLHLHQSTKHAVSEMGSEDTSRNIIEIIFQSSWLKKQSPVCVVDRILKVHNAPGTLARFEAYRDAVKARAASTAAGGGASRTRHPRCTADGNELLRFHCAPLACSLGLHGATHLCDGATSSCAACGIIRDGFSAGAAGVIRTMATSGRAHDAVEEEEEDGERRRGMLVCRVIAGLVKRAQETAPAPAPAPEQSEEEEEEYDSVAGSAGVYSNLEELEVFNPRAILPCFVVVYKA